MSNLQELQKKAEQLHDAIEEKNHTAKDFAKWVIDVKKIEGFSPSTISNIYNGISQNKATINSYCELCEEYLIFIEQEGTNKVVVNKSKLSLYLNRNYYLYYFETRKADDENFIGRAVLKIGATENDVDVKNAIADDTSTDYKGTISMNPKNENHIVLKLHTAIFKEKDLKIIFRISKDKETPYMVGGYMNIDKSEAIVMGTIIAVQTKESDPIPEVIKPNTETYKNLSSNIKKFLHFKEKNFIKIRTKGIFTDDDFNEFYKEQKVKFYTKTTTGAGKIFVAYPMSSIANFPELNETILKVSELLKTTFNVDAFFAGQNMNDNDDFDPPSIATNENLDLLNSCDRFIMIYPEKVVSSCLIELGFAIAQRKPCTIFYKKKEDLPYMLEDAGMIKKFSYKDDDDLIKKIQKIGLKLF